MNLLCCEEGGRYCTRALHDEARRNETKRNIATLNQRVKRPGARSTSTCTFDANEEEEEEEEEEKDPATKKNKRHEAPKTRTAQPS